MSEGKRLRAFWVAPWALVVGFRRLQATVGIIAGQKTRTVEYGQPFIRVARKTLTLLHRTFYLLPIVTPRVLTSKPGPAIIT